MTCRPYSVAGRSALFWRGVNIRIVDVVDVLFFFSSRRRHTRCSRDWSSDVCSSDLACGTSTLHALTPNTRADSSITHSDAGVLSTVTKFDASVEPKKNAFQLFVPACKIGRASCRERV